MKVVGIIPVRMAASRFPGKPLAKINGIPMVEHCYNNTKSALGSENTYIATCDVEIKDYMKSIGGNVIITSNSHSRATTRTAEALEIIENKLKDNIEVVVMVQGDEPLILPKTIIDTLHTFNDKTVNIVNIMSTINTWDVFNDKNNVKVVVNNNNHALYFSREPIPSSWKGWEHLPKYLQTGIIAFRRDELIRFNSIDETILEQIESIDMNRVLENGGKIKMILTNYETLGVDTEEDLLRVERMMSEDIKKVKC